MSQYEPRGEHLHVVKEDKVFVVYDNHGPWDGPYATYRDAQALIDKRLAWEREHRKPYSVWIKHDTDEWTLAFASWSPSDAREYARNKISYTGWHIVRVELRDRTGVLETVFDRSWT